jgi:hypothetical protein
MSGSWLVMPRRTCPAYPSSAAGGKEELRLAARRASWCVPQRRHQLALEQGSRNQGEGDQPAAGSQGPRIDVLAERRSTRARQARPAGSATLP